MFYTVRSGDTLYKIARENNISSTELLSLNNLDSGAILKVGQQLKVKKTTVLTNQTSNQYYIVAAGDSLYAIARKHNMSVNDLKKLNGFSSAATIYKGQKLKIKAVTSTKSEKVIKQKPSIKTSFYIVKRGDNILSIARKQQMDVLQLMKLNGLGEFDTIYEGMKLKVTGSVKVETQKPESKNIKTESYKVQRGENLITIAQKFNISALDLVKLNNLDANIPIYPGQILQVPETEKETIAPIDTITYTVQKGDWLGKIANKFRTTTKALMKLNNLQSGMISVGQPLFIPVAATPLIPVHLKSKIEKIRRIRKAFVLKEENGKKIFSQGLKGDVGNTYKNHPDDLVRVQKRLVQLGKLNDNHGESPNMLGHLMLNGYLSSSSIPKTIKAIEKFQKDFRIDYWTKRDKHKAMLGTSSFTKGIIKNHDLTYKILREFTKYALTIPHPYKAGEKITSEFTNFTRSSYNEYYDGVSFVGNSMPPVPFKVFGQMGLTPSLAKAVQYVSKHEGNYDSINSYDKAIFSWGFIQFAGNGGGFAPLIASIKHNEPKLFFQFFQQFGIDVTYKFEGGRIKKASLKVIDIHAINGSYEVTGLDAEKAIRADKLLYGCFLLAGYHPRSVVVQISNAVTGYVNPALSIRANIKTKWLNIKDIKLTEIINSPKGLGLMIDMTVNRWINQTRDIFVNSIQRIATQDSIHSLKQLKKIDEKKVIKDIISQATDQRIITRGNSILKSDLSAEKGSV